MSRNRNLGTSGGESACREKGPARQFSRPGYRRCRIHAP
jgi:hypothetical protein